MNDSASAEKAVLGAMLLIEEQVRAGVELIPPEAFYNTVHRAIFTEMVALYDEGEAIDIVTVAQAMESHEGLTRCGGGAYLCELVESYGHSAVADYAKILNQVYVRREVVRICALIDRQAKGDADTGDLVAQVEHMAAELARTASDRGVRVRRRGRLVNPVSVENELEGLYEAGRGAIGISPGWPEVAEYWRLVKGAQNIITGIPSHGKSEFVDAVCVNTAMKENWKWAIYSPENWPWEMFCQKIIEKKTGNRLLGMDRMSPEQMGDALRWMGEHFVLIEPDEDNTTLGAVMRLMQEAVDRHHVDGVVIDPWNTIRVVLQGAESRTNYIERSLDETRYFARKNNVVLLLVVHPQKLYPDVKTGKYRVPRLYDCADSAHFFNKADNGLTYYREDVTKHYGELHVQKVKYKAHGKPGLVGMVYDVQSGRFECCDPMTQGMSW